MCNEPSRIALQNCLLNHGQLVLVEVSLCAMPDGVLPMLSDKAGHCNDVRRWPVICHIDHCGNLLLKSCQQLLNEQVVLLRLQRPVVVQLRMGQLPLAATCWAGLLARVPGHFFCLAWSEGIWRAAEGPQVLAQDHGLTNCGFCSTSHKAHMPLHELQALLSHPCQDCPNGSLPAGAQLHLAGVHSRHRVC